MNAACNLEARSRGRARRAALGVGGLGAAALLLLAFAATGSGDILIVAAVAAAGWIGILQALTGTCVAYSLAGREERRGQVVAADPAQRAGRLFRSALIVLAAAALGLLSAWATALLAGALLFSLGALLAR
jgi:hypothetical protein